jgi:hypothetical protein
MDCELWMIQGGMMTGIFLTCVKDLQPASGHNQHVVGSVNN